MGYLSYEEYVDNGGTVSEDAFLFLERKASHYVDYYTFNRLKLFPPKKIPIEVKDVMLEYIERLNNYEKASSSADGDVISQYSNGVEQITYRRGSASEMTKSFREIALQWLPDYLVCRSVIFDVRQYLQPEDNNP